jgi:hypothetical protein
MSKFIRLTNYLINTNDIHSIVIKPNKYVIQIVSKKINGFNVGIFGFSIGDISSVTSEIEVCEKKHSNDYNIVSEFISKYDKHV